jgi:hypothetical protein
MRKKQEKKPAAQNHPAKPVGTCEPRSHLLSLRLLRNGKSKGIQVMTNEQYRAMRDEGWFPEGW